MLYFQCYGKIKVNIIKGEINKAEITPQKKMSMVEEFLQEQTKENFNSTIKKLNTRTEVAKKGKKQEKIIAQLNQIVNNK